MKAPAEIQGRCERCKVRFVWPDSSPRVLLRNAICPRCGSALKRTVHFVNLPVVNIKDPREVLRQFIEPI